jgi:glycolate oxidase iron-sulfur subunit
MQTTFTPQQLADPDTRASEAILRKCVHCGLCTATCPTYVELGDELDSPRGRIYLIKNMLEAGRAATEREVRHIDRCLSCLACMTACPSGVNYMHLVDHARHWIERTYRRPWRERALRAVLAQVLPYPTRLRAALRLAAPWRSLARRLTRDEPGMRAHALVAAIPPRIPAASDVDRPQVLPALGPRRKRVALLTGCVQPVIAPQIHEATIRLLRRRGCEVVIAEGAGCCGALTHHLGRHDAALAAARANVEAWTRADGEGALDAIVIDTSGCGTTVRNYGHLLRDDPLYAERAASISARTCDISELLATLALDADAPVTATAAPHTSPQSTAFPVITYHAACSLQHGQGVRDTPQRLLRAAGFTVREPQESHLCCGSAGTYHLLQPAISRRLAERKLQAIARTSPEAIATGNIGCMTQLAGGTNVPVVHTVELLDWASGGPMPPALQAARR